MCSVPLFGVEILKWLTSILSFIHALRIRVPISQAMLENQISIMRSQLFGIEDRRREDTALILGNKLPDFNRSKNSSSHNLFESFN
jgi:hypothetical protein